MKHKVSAIVNGKDLMFEGVVFVPRASAIPANVHKWFEAYKKQGPWTCAVCHQTVGEEGERVVVYLDLNDRNCFEVVHRAHAD